MTKAILSGARKTIQSWLTVQVLTIGFLTVLCFFFLGFDTAKSVFLGGMICFLPNVVFARSWFSFFSARYPQQMLVMFYFGECVKFCLMVALFLLLFKYVSVNIFACFIGFAGAQVGFCLGSIIKRN